MYTLPRTLSNQRRQWTAWLYQQLTTHQRVQLRQELMDHKQFPIAILFYHRVADRHANPWTISRRNFVRHLDWLQESFEIVSLSEAQARIRSGSNARPTIAITFDDGYAENCDFAIPELLRRKLPATYFVVSQAVAEGRPFAHDTLEHLQLAPNTVAEIRDMHRAGIEIGAHTRTHRDLGQVHSSTELADEILGCLEDLESWGIQPIRYFSFPYGLPQNTSQAAVDLLAQAGLHGFCTAYGAWNWPGDVGYHLRRIHADPGMQTLKNWLTLDRRKLADHHQLPFIEPMVKRSLTHTTGEVAVV